jgi:hypothetical protein
MTACVRCAHVGQKCIVGRRFNHAAARAANVAAKRANRIIETITGG